MNTQFLVPTFLALTGAGAATLAILSERRMQQHRQPGVTYGAVTFRRDGGWRRTELFTARGLEHQAQAARWGITAAVCWAAAFLSWVLLAT